MTRLLIGAICGAALTAVGGALWFAWYFSRGGGPFR